MDLLQGTLDMLVLRTLVFGPLHGYGIAKAIRSHRKKRWNRIRIAVSALKRLELKGWILSRWETSELNRRAKYYRLTPRGRKQLVRGAFQLGRVRGRRRARHGTGAGKGANRDSWRKLKYLSPSYRQAPRSARCGKRWSRLRLLPGGGNLAT